MGGLVEIGMRAQFARRYPMRDLRAFQSRFQDLAFRILLALPVAVWAVGVLHFADDSGNATNPRLEARAVTPFGADAAGAPIVVAARVVCSFANEDAAAASIKEFDGVTSVVADYKSFWLFGDSWLTRKRGGYLFANSTAARSTDADASDCVSLTYKSSGGIAEPLLALEKGESTAWPDGAVVVEPGFVDFYFASVKRTSSTKWDVTAVGLAQFDSETMNSRRLVERLWDDNSGFGDGISGARSPVLQGQYVFVFLHTTTNRHLLARVPADSIASATAYSYWDGAGWSPNPGDAKALWPETASEIPTHNGLSVRYSDFLGKWLAVYDHNLNTISVRVSDSLTGPWSSEVQWLDCKTLFASAVWPACYYAEQHVELSRDGGRTIYVTVSSAPPYDVYLLELRLGAAIHRWRDGEGRVAYSPASPGDAYADEGVSFYASDKEVPGFSPVYLWTALDGERIYSPEKPGAAFSRGDTAFYAPTSSSVSDSIVPCVPVYRWDAGTKHLYSTATTGLEKKGYVKRDVAFYAVCGDTNMDGVADCLE
jgi:hypothetical protein